MGKYGCAAAAAQDVDDKDGGRGAFVTRSVDGVRLPYEAGGIAAVRPSHPALPGTSPCRPARRRVRAKPLDREVGTRRRRRLRKGPGALHATHLPAGNVGKPLDGWDLHLALSYQLHERTGFVKPRDPIVANLLHDWATLNLAGGLIENADVLYDLAVTYGARRDALMRNRQAYIKRVLAQAGDAEPS